MNLSIFNSDMKKFILQTSIFSLVVLAFLVSVNYYGDSANLFKPSYENKIAEIIFDNHNATNVSNYDERKLQKEFVNRIDDRPDILVLGSSRTMLIRSTLFEGKKFINNSVSAASIEDLIAIYQLYKAKKILPKKIILCVDPWIFNKNNGKLNWKSLTKEYNSFSSGKEITEKKEFILNRKTKQLFSFSYFQASLSNLPSVIEEKMDSTALSLDPVASDDIYNVSSTKLVDGALSYSKEYREASKKLVTIKAQSYIKVKLYAIEDFEEVSPEIFEEFDAFCQEILSNNIELVFFLSPYHPVVFEKLKNEYEIVLEVENKISEYSKQNKIELLGSYDPLKLNVTGDGFYDGMHSKENTIKKILKIETDNDVYMPLSEW